ncbi:hypothetical protein EJB05_02761, partial [Eragrostis curvula]
MICYIEKEIFRDLNYDNIKKTFQIHTKRRNWLLHKRLNDIVVIPNNRKIKTRFQLMRENTRKKYALLAPDLVSSLTVSNDHQSSSYLGKLMHAEDIIANSTERARTCGFPVLLFVQFAVRKMDGVWVQEKAANKISVGLSY